MQLQYQGYQTSVVLLLWNGLGPVGTSLSVSNTVTDLRGKWYSSRLESLALLLLSRSLRLLLLPCLVIGSFCSEPSTLTFVSEGITCNRQRGFVQVNNINEAHIQWSSTNNQEMLHTWLQITQKSQLQNHDLDLTSVLGSSWWIGSFSTIDVLVVAATDSNGSLVCTTTIVAPTTSANQDSRQMGGAATMLLGRTRTQEEQQRRILQVLLVSFYLPESSISFTSTCWNASHRFCIDTFFQILVD